MSVLKQGQEALQSHCQSLLKPIEQALHDFSVSVEASDKAAALKVMKQSIQQLVLLEPFYSDKSEAGKAEQLSKLCVLLEQQKPDSDSEEQLRILIHFYQTLDQLL